MNEMPLISVIVPIYNAETYLNRCIDSILDQTFNEFELLLIDDGSIDNSYKICCDYAAKDKRVVVFQKANGGVSSARNIGIKKASGKYSIHVDSDDYIENSMLEEMYNAIISQNVEMIICDYYKVDQNIVTRIDQGGCVTSEDCISLMLKAKIHGSLWNKLILHELYEKHLLFFPEELKIREDLYMCISLLLLNIRIAYLGRSFYYYVQNPISLTKKRDELLIENQIKSTIKIAKLFDGMNKYESDVMYFKLVTRKDIFIVLKEKFLIKQIFPETNRLITKRNIIPIWLQIAFISIIYGSGFFTNLLFFLENRKNNR